MYSHQQQQQQQQQQQKEDRLSVLYKHLHPIGIINNNNHNAISTNNTSASSTQDDKSAAPRLIVKDSRTGQIIEIPIENGNFIQGTAFTKLQKPICIYDPAFMNTAVAKSKICFIDGKNGILRYRGYNIEDLAEKSSFMEVSFLLINGELPSQRQLDHWEDRIMKHSYLHENLNELLKQFRYDAHPMGMVISTLSALSTFYPQSNPALHGSDLFDKKNGEAIRNKQIYRILGKLPTIASCAYRHRIGKPYNQPQSELKYTENFLYMLDKLSETNYRPHPVLSRALDKLFIIHADHELNCSTAAMRHLSSSKVDPYTAMAGAAGALYGPLHGGACEAVLDMLEEIGTKENVPKFIEQVKKREKKLMGFGHRIYKSYDPRAKIARQLANEVFAILEKEPLIEVAIELEKIALSDPYFKERELYPNVDFYTGLIYKAMGFPTDMFPVLFCIPRAAGWLAHWIEALDDPDNKIFRPRQVYLGENERPYRPIHRRDEQQVRELSASVSQMSKRRVIKNSL